jgi:hypothetical protein
MAHCASSKWKSRQIEHLVEWVLEEETEVLGESPSANLTTTKTIPTELGLNCGQNLVTNHLSYGLALVHQLSFWNKQHNLPEMCNFFAFRWRMLCTAFFFLRPLGRATLSACDSNSNRAEIFSYPLYLNMKADPFLKWCDFYTKKLRQCIKHKASIVMGHRALM